MTPDGADVAFVVVLLRRFSRPGDDWLVIGPRLVARLGAGIAALVLALGAGSIAVWCLVAFVVADAGYLVFVGRGARGAG
jgi:hypothetical protein